MATAFTGILQGMVDHVHGARAAIFAAWDGEVVDCVTVMDRDAVLLLAAHYGIILNHVQSALHTFHFGEAHEIILLHEHLDLLVRAVGEGYYVVLAVEAGAHLATALREVAAGSQALRSEMY